MQQHRQGIFALLAVTLVWGTTFPAMKDLTSDFSPVWIIFTRFAIAALLLLPFLLKASRNDLKSGGLLGGVLFFCYLFQVEGLALTSSNRNAFICGLNVLVVPLLGIAMGKMPGARIAWALLLAVSGLTALCWDDAAWSFGDTLALLSAFCFGIYIKLMEVWTRKADTLLSMTATQITTVALCAATWLLVREPASWVPVAHQLGGFALNFLYLGVICTAAIISLQSWGQSRTNANEAAVIYAFEPAAAALFGYFMLGEIMTPMAWAGAALLISGMIVSQWNSERPVASLAPE
jgi:drug/metabolite transporter (DMT)-like permease